MKFSDGKKTRSQLLFIFIFFFFSSETQYPLNTEFITDATFAVEVALRAESCSFNLYSYCVNSIFYVFAGYLYKVPIELIDMSTELL